MNFDKRVKILSNKKTFLVEFMHYVMMTRSLSKVFISIKGYYYQADIMGHKVTWIVAHPNPHAVSKSMIILRCLTIFFLAFYNSVLFQ